MLIKCKEGLKGAQERGERACNKSSNTLVRLSMSQALCWGIWHTLFHLILTTPSEVGAHCIPLYPTAEETESHRGFLICPRSQRQTPIGLIPDSGLPTTMLYYLQRGGHYVLGDRFNFKDRKHSLLPSRTRLQAFPKLDNSQLCATSAEGNPLSRISSAFQGPHSCKI